MLPPPSNVPGGAIITTDGTICTGYTAPMDARLDPMDRGIVHIDRYLRTCAAPPRSRRPSPAGRERDAELTPSETRESIRLMRVNHAGEVAAQALYHGQALLARDAATRRLLEQAAGEEADHLAWCAARLDELGGRTSLIVPAWYVGSFAIGIVAALVGDSTSLGFVRETERQVEAHLDDHLNRLPAGDRRSRSILRQMSQDEDRHGRTAAAAGGVELPVIVRRLMGIGGSVVRRVARVL